MNAGRFREAAISAVLAVLVLGSLLLTVLLWFPPGTPAAEPAARAYVAPGAWVRNAAELALPRSVLRVTEEGVEFLTHGPEFHDAWARLGPAFGTLLAQARDAGAAGVSLDELSRPALVFPLPAALSAWDWATLWLGGGAQVQAGSGPWPPIEGLWVGFAGGEVSLYAVSGGRAVELGVVKDEPVLRTWLEDSFDRHGAARLLALETKAGLAGGQQPPAPVLEALRVAPLAYAARREPFDRPGNLLPEAVVRSEFLDRRALAASLLGDLSLARRIEGAQGDIVYGAGNASVTFGLDESVTYRAVSEAGHVPARLTPREALEAAARFVSIHGGWPEGAALQGLAAVSDPVAPTGVRGYRLRFSVPVAGVPLAATAEPRPWVGSPFPPPSAPIEVVIDGGGAVALYYRAVVEAAGATLSDAEPPKETGGDGADVLRAAEAAILEALDTVAARGSGAGGGDSAALGAWPLVVAVEPAFDNMRPLMLGPEGTAVLPTSWAVLFADGETVLIDPWTGGAK